MAGMNRRGRRMKEIDSIIRRSPRIDTGPRKDYNMKTN